MMLRRVLLILIGLEFAICIQAQQKRMFNYDWEFVKDIDTVFSNSLTAKNSGIKWEKISLPHTASLEPIVKVAQQWQGICFYRKFFSVPASYKGKHIAIQFDAAMQEADVYLNGEHIFNHKGGYLPFYVDVSKQVKFGVENSILVKLDNRDNPLIPPGKPLKSLDFNYYSGIYRNAWLIIKDKLHISDAVAVNKTAGGGVFVHYTDVTDKSATIVVQTEVKNDHGNSVDGQIRVILKDKGGKTVAQSSSESKAISPDSSQSFTQNIPIDNPILWSPDEPFLYQLSVELIQNGKAIDRELVNTGIRAIRFEAGAFYLNGKKVKLRGTNRHQEYPYLGNAASDNAQYRDVWKMKQAGFNFVRSSHYPQSPAYLNACDELGIMVMDAIPGWQFVGSNIFQQNSLQDIRDMIRRDRNHPSVILWEASLNETGMKKDYMEKAHKIVHEELPFQHVYSAGWIDNVYDVYLPARQHAKAPDWFKKYNKDKPFIIAEYGDWEYYAQNAGFNQTAYNDLKPEERTSRQLRTAGEKGLLQQALNYQESHNDNLYSSATGDANWLMFDYNRGYASDIESSGIMDMTRLPKFAFYFYQSQIDPVVTGGSPFNKPMLFIANYLQAKSDTNVTVYSNCEEVELLLNGKSMGKQRPDKNRFSTNLKHPPFTFHVNAFNGSTLTAIGYINDKEIIQEVRKTAGASSKINLAVDVSGKELQAGQNDIVFVYAHITDNKGTVIYNAANKIQFEVNGNAEIVGDSVVQAEAGIATIVLKAGLKAGKIEITAKAEGLQSAQIWVTSR